MRFAKLADALAEIQRLRPYLASRRDGDWSAAEVIHHCAQSIEMSMAGFPKPKSKLFQVTVGRLAFKRFKSRGFLQHDRGAAIPGAPPVADDSVESAVRRLETAIRLFETHATDMAPHFAYGALSKEDTELAHLMHLADHLEGLMAETAQASIYRSVRP